MIGNALALLGMSGAIIVAALALWGLRGLFILLLIIIDEIRFRL